MRAIVIDSQNKQVREVELGKDYHEIYNHIGNGCTCFSCPVTLENGDSLYVDDEGLYSDIQGGFIMQGWSYPIVGNAVLLNCDEEGESTDALSDLAELEKQIRFIGQSEAIAHAQQSLGTPPRIYWI